MTDKLVTKIKNLLNLTKENGATENEALNALDLANKLMDKHDIDMATVLAFSADKEYTVTVDTTVVTRNKKMVKWKYFTLSACAILFGCKAIVEEDIYDTCNIVAGSVENRELTVVLYEQLESLINSLTDIHTSGCSRSYKNSYRLGIAHKLQTRAKYIVRENARKAEENSNLSDEVSTALATIKDANREAIIKWCQDQDIQIQKVRNKINEAGYQSGKDRGESIPLNAGISGDTSPKVKSLT